MSAVTQLELVTDNKEKFDLEYFNNIVDFDKLDQIAKEKAEAYQTGEPFPHIVLDDVFDPAFLEKVANEFPDPNSPDWQQFNNLREKKLATQDERDIGPYARAFISNMHSGSFLRFLEKLTGIEDLLPDPHLTGGGLHRIMKDGKLSVHVDFNRHRSMPLERRLNVLVYLNQDWKEEYGGHFELWDKDMTKAEKKVLPLFNRMAMFTTSETSWHGHPEPLTCPEDRSRRSIALYYYTVGRPDEDQGADTHTTVFRERPGEELFSDVPKENKLKAFIKDCIPPILLKHRD